MRRAWVLWLCLFGASESAAGERAPAVERGQGEPASERARSEPALPRGRAVRIEKPPRREVFVPAGIFEMGVDEATAGAAREQCRIVFSPEAIAGPGGLKLDFCGEDYYHDLVHMQSRAVFVDAFAIDRDEVSVVNYRSCVDAGGCELDALVAGDERYIGARWPMVNVTWGEAQQFCRWRGGRLPTEAEWERAARGDRPEALWPWGELEQPRDFNHGQPRSPTMREIDAGLQYPPMKFFGDPDDSDGAMLLAPSGSYPWGEGPFGTRDQAGNVAEWTADAYFQDDRRVGYEDLSTVNPMRDGPPGQPRVVRGGSWRQPTFLAQSNLRDPFNREYSPERRFSHIGFRCARTLH